MLPAYHLPEEGEVFNTFHDMVHAAILSAGTGAASLKEIYAACMRFGRVKCRKTGGWRLVTERRNWKSHIRHTLYTTEKFLRCPDDADSWTLAPGYSHTLPQTTRHSKESTRQAPQTAGAANARSGAPPGRPPGTSHASARSGRQPPDPLHGPSRGQPAKRPRAAAAAASLPGRRGSADGDSWVSEDEQEAAGLDAAEEDYADNDDPDQIGLGAGADPYQVAADGDCMEGEQPEEDAEVEDEDEGADAVRGGASAEPRGPQALARTGVGRGPRTAAAETAGQMGPGTRGSRSLPPLGPSAAATAAATAGAAAAASASAAAPDVADASGWLDLSDLNTRRAWMAAQEVVNNPVAARIVLLMIHQRQHFLEAPLQAHLAQWQTLERHLPQPLLPAPMPFQQPLTARTRPASGFLPPRAQPVQRRPLGLVRGAILPGGGFQRSVEYRQPDPRFAHAGGHEAPWEPASGYGINDAEAEGTELGGGEDEEEGGEAEKWQGAVAGRRGIHVQRQRPRGYNGGDGSGAARVVDRFDTSAAATLVQSAAGRFRGHDQDSLEGAALLADIAAASAAGSRGWPRGGRAYTHSPGTLAQSHPRATAAAVGRRAAAGGARFGPGVPAFVEDVVLPAAAVDAWGSGAAVTVKMEHPYDRYPVDVVWQKAMAELDGGEGAYEGGQQGEEEEDGEGCRELYGEAVDYPGARAAHRVRQRCGPPQERGCAQEREAMGLPAAQSAHGSVRGLQRRQPGHAGLGAEAGVVAMAPPPSLRMRSGAGTDLAPGGAWAAQPQPQPQPTKRPASPPQPPAGGTSPRLAPAASLPQTGASVPRVPLGPHGGGAGAAPTRSAFASAAAAAVQEEGLHGAGFGSGAAAADDSGLGSRRSSAGEASASAGRKAGGFAERTGSLGKRPLTDSNSSSFGADLGDAGEEQQQLLELRPPGPTSQHPYEPKAKRMCSSSDVAEQLAGGAAVVAEAPAAGPAHGSLRRPPLSSAFAGTAGPGEEERS